MGLIIALVLGLLPSFGWLVFYLQEDIRHPEPKKLIFYTFLAGAFSTIFVLQLQIYVDKFLLRNIITPYTLGAFLILGTIEEVAKFIATYLVVGRRKELDEPIDAMIYMIVSALGFAAVENIASIFKVINGLDTTIGPVETITLRFIGATLLHTLSSGLIGYYWGLAMAQKNKLSNYLTRGLIWAILLHTIFNYFIINFESIAIAIALLITIAFLVLNDFEKLKNLYKT